MLSNTQYRQYVTFQHSLSASARQYLDMVRATEASRMVGVHAGQNVCSWITSSKMGRTISSESRGPEKAFILLSEFDDDIIEIWDQPEPIQVERVDRKGLNRRGSYSPDFLVLSANGPRVIEVKPESRLRELVVEQPENWIKEEYGYRYVPADTAFRNLGLIHKVFAYSSEMAVRVANLDLILRSRDVEIYDPALPLRVEAALGESFSWSLYDLKTRLGLASYSGLLQLLDRKKLFSDLENDLLSEPESCFVAPSKILVKEAAEIRCTERIFTGERSSTLPISIFPSFEYALKALDKLARLESGENSRSSRRWKKAISNAQSIGLSPFQALIPKTFLSGNRVPRINKVVSQFLGEYLVNDYALSQGLSQYRGYIRYKALALDFHPSFPPVSRKTFDKKLSQIPASVVTHGRAGKRGSNAVADPSNPFDRALKAQTPWSVAAIDHYKADVYLIFYSNQGVVHVERPWVSAMIDLATGCILAITLSFRDPSRVACAKVIRECVRRHKCLPAEIIVDRGSDFKSVYFSSLLAHYRVTLSMRPAAHSRYGGEVEGFFGEFKKQWLSQRPGNLADYKEARSVDGKKAPKNSAILKPYDLYRELNAFCSWRDAKPKTIDSKSAIDRFLQGQKDFPFVAKPVEYNDEFLLVTAVDHQKYTVDQQRGIHINELYYYSPSISKIRGKKSKLPVRRDPENPHLIYALIDDVWEPCYSSHINQFKTLNHNSQFEKGLVAIEAVNMRRKLNEESDVELVRIIREMDKLAGENLIPVVSISNKAQSPSSDSIFDCSDIENIEYLRDLKVGEW